MMHKKIVDGVEIGYICQPCPACKEVSAAMLEALKAAAIYLTDGDYGEDQELSETIAIVDTAIKQAQGDPNG